MFRLESYITPIIWSYFSKYVKNFNSHDFQVSLWEGGAVFSNLELNLDVLDSELQIPLSFSSGHIQELKITVPWRKITSEPIVLNVNSMELVLHHREQNDDLKRKKVPDEVLQSNAGGPNQEENSGYMRSLITKIVSNVRVNFENVVIKYVESDIAFSVNVGEASMAVTDENWKTVFLDRIAYSPDFVLRKKLSFSDVNICLDRCNNAGLVDKFQDPMLYRCDFDVRIVQKFATSFSRVPYFYRMDLFLGHLQFCVTDEQIPMLVRLYNLFTWLMESGTIDTQVNDTKSSPENEPSDSFHDPTITENATEAEELKLKENSSEAENPSWTSWATGWLFNLPVAVFGEDDETGQTGEVVSSDQNEVNDTGGPHPDPQAIDIAEEKDELQLPPPTTHFGVYIKTLTIIFKAVKRGCDRPVMQRKIIMIYPFLKCSIQGVVCDFIARGNENSHTLGVSSIMVDGLGYCPCGVQDCSSSEVALPAQGGECYFEAGKINPEFSALSFFESREEPLPDWCYDVDQKSFLCYDEESKMLEKTPAFVLRYIVIRNESDVTDQSRNNLQKLKPEISEVVYHGVAAPCKILVCSGLIHRLKMIYGAINNYGYEPYGIQVQSNNSCKSELENNWLQQPVTTYRLVIRQPLIEIFAADHPSDYCSEKRAEYFRRSGGVIPTIVLPRLTPEWPRMVISWDSLECTAEDTDGHFNRLRNCLSSQITPATTINKPKHCEGTIKWADEERSRNASVNMSIAEVLFTFISEPMELNLGIKTGSLQLCFVNRNLCELSQIDGSVILDSVTCSSRLELRSNVLWLPLTVGVLSTVHFQENLLLKPSITCTVDTTSLNVFIGPETVITLSQLITKLQVYLEEFLPRLSDSQELGSVNIPANQMISKYCDDFKSISLPIFDHGDCSKYCYHETDVGICLTNQSLFWRYRQKRTIHGINITGLVFPLCEGDATTEIQFELEYLHELFNVYYHFSSFKISEGSSVIKQLYHSLEHNVISSAMWRIRIVDEGVKVGNILELLAKQLVIESIHIPEISLRVRLPEVLLNLVNNTFYSGKHIDKPELQPYGNTDGVCPSDHILAAFHLKNGRFNYTTIEGLARCNMDFDLDLKVLDYESVVLEPVIDSVAVGFELLIPEAFTPYTLNLATDNISVKIGASLTHSIMYSASLWNQIISSFDNHNFKMASNENLPKIILNRVLVSNDLNKDVSIRCTDPESFGAEKIPSKDCKAISFPSRNGSLCGEKNFYASLGTTTEVKISLQRSGYTPYKLDSDTIFVKVSSLSASQKLVNISGPLILANGLDRAVEVSLLLHDSTSVVKTVLPSGGLGPTLLYSFGDVDHFRFRFISSQSQQPWSEVIESNLLTKDGAESRSCVVIKMLSLSSDAVSETNIWLTKITEEVHGAKRHLIALSPVYCLRSWLCSETLVHLTSAQNKNVDIYSVHGKGKEVEIKANTQCVEAYFMKFQSSTKVPPSGEEVKMAEVMPALNNNARPIDDLLAQLIHTNSNTRTDQENNSKWPFIDEDILPSEWNTEINPETEIMVSYAPWIEGLPTTVAEIRPWALFINLSGVDLLFAQEITDHEWDQYWVAYKCAFSPKRMEIPGGKFRLGVMMNDFLVKSPALQFSDQPERLSVKKINKDGKVPIDCYSRLDFFGGSQVVCLTIETRVRNKILVFVIRPTYSIQNRTSIEMFAAGVTTSSATPQRRESWTDDRLDMYNSLEPNFSDLSEKTAVPILHFATDGQDYSAKTPSFKYLALSCGGPWWFTQLVDCSEDRADQKTSEGIPGSVVAVNLPKVDCTILSPMNRHKLKAIKVANESVVVGLYTKNGQVWVSISENNSPQFTIHNKSKVPLFYVEKDQKEDVPRLPTPCFKQFLMVPPKTSCNFSACSTYSNFPQLNKRETTVPDLLLAEVSQDLVDFVTSHHAQSLIAKDNRQPYSNTKQSAFPSGNLLFPEFDIDWQKILNVSNNPTQYAKFGRQSVTVTVEIVGYTYHVFIENTKMKEVSAKAIIHGFTTPRTTEGRKENGQQGQPSVPDKRDTNHSYGSVTAKVSAQRRLSSSTIGLEERDKDDEGPPSPTPELSQNRSFSRPWKVKVYIPELYISILDDIEGGGKSECEFMGLTFEPVIIEQMPLFEDSRLRSVECPKRESWIYAIRVGNIQVDTPNVEGQRPCEFLVVLEAVNKNERCICDDDRSAFAIPKFMSTMQQPSILNFDSTITVTRISPDEVNLETIWLKVRPFSLYIEDRLLSYVIPSMQSILDVFNEGYVTLGKTYANTTTTSGKRGSCLSTAESGITTHLSILDSSTPVNDVFGVGGQEFGLFGLTPHKRQGEMHHSQNLFSRGISFAPPTASSSSGLNSSNSSIISPSLAHMRLASVSPPPPSPMMYLETHGSSGKMFTREIAPQVTISGPEQQDEPQDEETKDLFAVQRINVPNELLKLFNQLSRPVKLKKIDIRATELELTLRTEKVLYVSLDRSVVQLRPFVAYSSITTDFHLGLELTMHYTVGTIFTIGNPVRVLGSLELLGSPGTLARTVGTGLRDLVVYPYEGILNGPVGFVSGLGYGVSSLLQSVTSGTLNSLTNWAQSVSRNIDRLTLDQEEQLISEAARQVELQGFSDGIVQGLSGFGIRILGAIGGLSHHPMNSVIQRGPSATSVIGGVSRGMIGVVVKPIGGVAELISMTGQGVLLATGWKPRPKAKKPKKKAGSF